MNAQVFRTKINFFVSIGLISVFGILMTTTIVRSLATTDVINGLIQSNISNANAS